MSIFLYEHILKRNGHILRVFSILAAEGSGKSGQWGMDQNAREQLLENAAKSWKPSLIESLNFGRIVERRNGVRSKNRSLEELP